MAKKILSAEDSALFRQSIGEVKPVKNDTVTFENVKKPRPVPKSSPLEPGNPFTADLSGALDKLANEDRLAYLSPGLQKNILKKLRKGYYGLDADLDLHGLTSQQARQHLARFLHDCVEQGCRCVHIIHGKGYRSANDYPILKNDVNIWLRQHQDVLAFCSTAPKHGGTGAVFVLLKLSEKFDNRELDF